MTFRRLLENIAPSRLNQIMSTQNHAQKSPEKLKITDIAQNLSVDFPQKVRDISATERRNPRDCLESAHKLFGDMS